MILRDQLNVPTRAELYTFVLADFQAITVLGNNVMGDIPAELWYFDATSMAVDDGIKVVQPSAIPVGSPGRYLLHMVQADWNALFNKPVISASSIFFTLTTDASGVATITYPSAYANLPFLRCTIRTGPGTNAVLPSYTCIFSSQTTSGFSIKMQNRVDALGLLPSYQNVANATVDVQLTPR